MSVEQSQARPGPSVRTSQRVAESIANDLRQRILRGALDDGPLPTQDALVAEYGVSGPSIREALRILEAEGLITVRRGKLGGAHVHRPDWATAAFSLAMSLQGQGIQLSDLAESLLVLEPLCAASCARRPDRLKTVVPALRANLEESERAVGDGARFTAVSRDFHDMMVDHATNQTTRLLVRSTVAVWSVQEETWASMLQREGHYPAESEQVSSLKAHRKLVDLIEAGDVDEAERFACAHLRATQRLVLEESGERVIDASSPAALRYFRSL